MKTIFDLCKRLDNPIRRELLRRVYTSPDGGANVTLAQDNCGLGMSGTSQYLRQLEELGLIRRQRSGRYVNYLADWSMASPEIQVVAEGIYARFKAGKDIESLAPVFHTMMNPFRARVLNWLLNGGSGEKDVICERFDKRRETVARDLKPAIDDGLLDMTDDDESSGEYLLLKPTDPLALKILEFSV